MAYYFKLFISLFLALEPLVDANPAPSHHASTACAVLAARYPTLTSFPGSEEYTNVTADQWSLSCIRSSYCIFEPESAQQVSTALRTFQSTQTEFAVRSGGHMPVPGAAAISNGVLVHLSRLNTMNLVNRNLAQVGAGNRWGPVFRWISSYGLAIAGGRFAPVGVSGVLLGGGINWFGSEKGWSANTIRNYQIVLADGSIVNANATSNPDLFWALKGGANNFGIVTRFDLEAFPVTDIYGGFQIFNSSVYADYLRAVANYISPNGGIADATTAIDPITVITPSTGEFFVANFLMHRGSDPDPIAFKNFTAIPTLSSTVRLRKSFAEFESDTENPQFSDHTKRQLFWVTSVKALPESVYLVNKTFVEAALSQLSDIAAATTSVTYQPISQAWLARAKASGGDAIDLDPDNGGFVSILISSAWEKQEHDQRFNDFSIKLIAEIDKRSKAAGLYYPFKYLNDAGGSQPIYQNYGGGKSLPRLKAIRKSYDENDVFQKLLPGGFKIGL